MNYFELDLVITPTKPWSEIFISKLADIEFESFTEEEDGIHAYIQENSLKLNELHELLNSIQSPGLKFTYQLNLIESQNWNALWESQFEPVIINNDLIIRAPFNKIQSKYKYEITIQPQMSFGTGHHQTTWLLCNAISSSNIEGKKILDVGTGTGILAILCKLMGGEIIKGIDIDKNAIENAIDNMKLNNISDIAFLEGEINSVHDSTYNIIIANINKNVLKAQLNEYAIRQKLDGELFLSGFFTSDNEDLIILAESLGYYLVEPFEKEEWSVLKLKKVK